MAGRRSRAFWWLVMANLVGTGRAGEEPSPSWPGNERLARAVLLFFRGGPWTDNDRAVWESMTGYPTPTAATLCDFAREVLADERMRSQGLRGADQS
jgi:hypothetical protein